MTENDTSRAFAGACPGGREITRAAGVRASPNLYNHIITAMQGIKEAADAAGKTSSLFVASPSCRWKTTAQHRTQRTTPQLEQFYSDVNTDDGMAIFGQTRPPHWYFYQGGGMYTSDTKQYGCIPALLDFCDNHPVWRLLLTRSASC